MEQVNITPCCETYIMELLQRIDKMQKEAVLSEEGNCVTCQNALFSFTNI